jgi:hypothetical protein
MGDNAGTGKGKGASDQKGLLAPLILAILIFRTAISAISSRMAFVSSNGGLNIKRLPARKLTASRSYRRGY